MTHRYCPTCGAKLSTTTSRGGLTRRVCPNCDADDDGRRCGGNNGRHEPVTDGGTNIDALEARLDDAVAHLDEIDARTDELADGITAARLDVLELKARVERRAGR